MANYEYIYGSKVIIQCQAYLEVHPWDGSDPQYSRYLDIIEKEDNFFTHWCKPRSVVKCIIREPPEEKISEEIRRVVGTEIDDMLIERERAISWTKNYKNKEKPVVRGPGHSKHQLILKTTFCAKDQGVDFRLPEYTSTS